MKIISLTLFLFLLLSLNCSAQSASLPVSSYKNLLNTWKFFSASGGISGKGPGWTKENNISIRFKKNGSYYFYENGKDRQSDTFTIKEHKSIISGEMEQVIDYKNNIDQSFHVRDDTLILNDEVHDGFNYIFVKK